MRETEMGLIKRKEEMEKKGRRIDREWEIGMERVEEWKKHQVEENKKKKMKGSIYYHACEYYHPCNALFQPIDMPAVQPKRRRRALLAIKND